MVFLPQITFEIVNEAIGYDPSGGGLNLLISNLIGAATMFAGIAMLGYLIYGAITWATAGGNEEKIETAQKAISNALIGMLIVVLATTIAAIVGSVIGTPILSPPWETLRP
ncbi:MAG: hypothetical protein U9M98_00635 [Patescibacteria group bacterium]|nr:hypothetical protein [Patescibacteria group bacterium]